MTPPAPKTKNPGKTGGSSRKTAAKPSAAKGGTKKAAPKKRAPRKKRKSKTGKGLLIAFAAGLVLASLAFWLLRDISLPTLREIAERDRTPPPAATRTERAPVPERTGNGKSGDRENRQTQALPKLVKAPASPPGRNSAVESALMDLQSLAYEEGPIHTLDDRARQVDYALMQAAWIKKLPAQAMRQVFAEDRVSGSEHYRFQRIDILPGKTSAVFVDALRDCLALWGEGALLKPSGKESFTVSLGGVQTHAIRLYPGKTEFPPLPVGVEQPSTGKSAPPPDMTQPRVRGGDEKPKLVIVIDDLGASQAAVDRLLGLDYPVTFAFWPHGAHTRSGAVAAHARGMEILVHQPMEPLGYPNVKPGPNVLLASMNEGQIRRILDSSIAAVPYAVGLNNHMGSRFTQDAGGVKAVIRLLRERGLFMLDSLTHSKSVFAKQGKQLGIERYCRNVFLDVTHSRAKVLEELRRAERIAQITGQAVAIGHPLPETLAALADWQRMRDKSVAIVRLRDLVQDP